jgi:hypothetical protein
VRSLSLTIFLFWSIQVVGQQWYEPADSLNKKRAIAITSFQTGVYATTMSGLYFAWYNQYKSSGFHFFNDWVGWSQMDKAGHAITSYQIPQNLYKINKWAGVSEKKAIWYAAGLGYSYQLFIEVMDGYSTGWGFSNGDLLFNTVGNGLFLSQQLGWKEQRISLKYSFFPSGMTNLPGDEGHRARNLYGETVFEQWLKDYNAQTYWASFNIWSLTGKSDHVPKWLNLAVGYSVNNLLGAESNTWTDPDNPTAKISSTRLRERQFLLSLDVDMQRVNLPKPLLWLRPVFGLIKFPFPALEFNTQKGFRGHLMYY